MKVVIEKQVFKRSLNPTDKQIRYIELQHDWKEFDRRRKANANHFQLTYTPLTFEKYLIYNQIDLEKHLKKPVIRMNYYSQFSKYKNNLQKRIKN